MDILKLLLDYGMDDSSLDKMSQKSGLDKDSVKGVISKVAPLFMQQAKANLTNQDSSNGFLDMVKKTNINDTEDINHGNNLLGFLTGSKENSRKLSSEVGKSLGVDVSSVKTLLPMIAPLVAGMLNKHSAKSGLGALSSFLDKDGDGSITDDLFNMAKGFFKR